MAKPDVNAFGSSWGVESEPPGSRPGYLGSNRPTSDFAGNSAVWV